MILTGETDLKTKTETQETGGGGKKCQLLHLLVRGDRDRKTNYWYEG